MQVRTDSLSRCHGIDADRLARRAVVALLGMLSHGQLRLIDDDGELLFGDADGADTALLQVHDMAFYRRALFGGTVGVGESYVDGEWDSPDPVALIRLMLRNYSMLERLDYVIGAPVQWLRRFKALGRRNTRSGAKRNILSHYDIGNDFYQLILDRQTMAYSCAIFEPGDSLSDAQTRKFDAICQALDLRPGEQLLEIGTGWGGLAIHAATHYGVQVTTTTISDEQHAFAEARIEEAGLRDRITLLKSDYRDLRGQFDKLVSVEMIEAVGHAWLPTYCRSLDALLKPGGRLLLQSITIADQRYEQYRRQVDFIQKHIFPGGFLPSVNALSNALRQHTSLQMTALRDIGPHYATTLQFWSTRLAAARDQLPALGLDERFYRLWQFYFKYCEAGFRDRCISTVHLCAEKPRIGAGGAS